jgi:phosphopentomutase
VIYGAPKVLLLAIDLHEDRVEMSLRLCDLAQSLARFFLISEVDMGPNLFHHLSSAFMANTDPTFVK